MSRWIAIALRLFMTASLLLAGAGGHATKGAGPVDGSEAAVAAAPCHGDEPSSGEVGPPSPGDPANGHCDADCGCPCMALPMLLPEGVRVMPTMAGPARAARFTLPWRSATSLPDLRPPIT